VQIIESLGGTGGCFDNLGADLVVTYKDTKGITQTSEFNSNSLQSVRIGGTATSVRATLTITFFNCDSGRSATCSMAAVAAPK
jgi:hypothetical protein